jgi:hypothetical protein
MRAKSPPALRWRRVFGWRPITRRPACAGHALSCQSAGFIYREGQTRYTSQVWFSRYFVAGIFFHEMGIVPIFYLWSWI